jgi:hypothetical protein
MNGAESTRHMQAQVRYFIMPENFCDKKRENRSFYAF